MKALLKAFLTTRREDIEGAIVLVILASSAGLAAWVLHFNDIFHYAFGMAFGVIAMLLVNLVAYFKPK